MSIKSIWDGIDQNAFQDALEQRANKGRWATHSMTKASNITRLNHDDSSYPFSFETETNLAEYFAFLAAWKNDPHYVSAATVCLKRHQEGLLISLAANDGVAKEVHGAFQEVLTTLQQCADDCELLCLHQNYYELIVVSYNLQENLCHPLSRTFDRPPQGSYTKATQVQEERPQDQDWREVIDDFQRIEDQRGAAGRFCGAGKPNRRLG